MIDPSNTEMSQLHAPTAGPLGRRRAKGIEDLSNPADSRVGSLHAETVDRLTRLRRILPVIGEELAVARREAARLRLENRRLLERVAELERGFGSVRGKPRLARSSG